MNCQTCRIEIEEMETNERLSERASEHIASCPPCRAFHDERQSLRRLVGSLEPVNAPPDFEFRLRARLAATGNGQSPRITWRSLIGSAPAIGLAATFALLVGGLILYNQIRTEAPAVNQPNEIAHQGPNSKPETQSVTATTGTVDSKPTPDVAAPDAEQKPSPMILTAGVKNKASQSSIRGKDNRRQPRRFETGGSQIQSNDIAFGPAPQIKPGGDSTLAQNQLVELPVRSSSQPVRVLVNDRSGGRRTVFLEPVIFGSQDLTGGGGQRVATTQGIW